MRIPLITSFSLQYECVYVIYVFMSMRAFGAKVFLSFDDLDSLDDAARCLGVPVVPTAYLSPRTYTWICAVYLCMNLSV